MKHLKTFESFSVNEEAFGDILRSYDTIFFRDNKEMVEKAKSTKGDERDSIYNELLKIVNKFIKDKGMESGSAQSLKNELRRKVYGGDFRGKQS
jgi:hypothetical protein